MLTRVALRPFTPECIRYLLTLFHPSSERPTRAPPSLRTRRHRHNTAKASRGFERQQRALLVWLQQVRIARPPHHRSPQRWPRASCLLTPQTRRVLGLEVPPWLQRRMLRRAAGRRPPNQAFSCARG